MAADRETFRLMLVGNSGVGKSCLLQRFTKRQFSERRAATIAIDVATTFVCLMGKKVELRIWDTAGQERFRSIGVNFYRSADGVMVVYSVTDEASFAHVTSWMQEVDRHAKENVAKMLVGNKCDLDRDRVIDYSLGRKYASEFHMPFMETSAKDGLSVDDAFLTLAMEVRDRRKYSPQPEMERSLSLVDTPRQRDPRRQQPCCATRLWTDDNKILVSS